MKIIISEKQLRNLRKSLINENHEIDEIDVYKYPEHPKDVNEPEPDPEEYYKDKKTHTFMKEVGDFEYLCEFKEDDGIGGVAIHVLDKVKKIKVAIGDFEQRNAEDFFVELPYVMPEYRKKGIAKQMYLIVLSFGNLVSGKAQSEEAVELWKSMYRVFPNKMVFVDNKGKEHEIKATEDNKLVVKDSGEDVHSDTIGGYLKLYKS